MESLKNFVGRVEDLTGLPIGQIPDGKIEDSLRGIIVAASPHGMLIGFPLGGWEDEDGNEMYEDVVLVRNNENLPDALPGASGKIRF